MIAVTTDTCSARTPQQSLLSYVTMATGLTIGSGILGNMDLDDFDLRQIWGVKSIILLKK